LISISTQAGLKRALTRNPNSEIYRGFITAMLDDTLGPAIIIKTRGEFMGPTIDLHSHFLSPVKLGPITAEGRVTKLGQRVAFTEGQLFDADGKLCARATSSTMLLPISKN